MTITNEHVQKVITDYINRYLNGNRSATLVAQALVHAGIGLRPLVDHISVRTLDVQERAMEFEALGYRYDDHLGVIEADSWWAKLYRRPGFPAVYMSQAFADHRGEDSAIPRWVERFSDNGLHHIALLVEDVDDAVEQMRNYDVTFAGAVEGDRQLGFRHIYTEPELVDGEPFSVLELVERRWGFTGFITQPNLLTTIRRAERPER